MELHIDQHIELYKKIIQLNIWCFLYVKLVEDYLLNYLSTTADNSYEGCS